MTDERHGRLVLLSGPSCVGKSPLAKALAKFYPELRKTLQPLVLFIIVATLDQGRWMESTTISVPASK
jgi:chloramphenicol 3-O-phosphotransferase